MILVRSTSADCSKNWSFPPPSSAGVVAFIRIPAMLMISDSFLIYSNGLKWILIGIPSSDSTFMTMTS